MPTFKRRVPLGKAIRWSQIDGDVLLDLATPNEADIAEARAKAGERVAIKAIGALAGVNSTDQIKNAIIFKALLEARLRDVESELTDDTNV